MGRNLKVISLALFAAMITSCAEKPQKTLMERAEELQRSILTVDTHCDTPMSFLNPSFDVTKEGTGCIDFPKMRAGSLNVESFAVFTPQRYDEGYVDAMYAKAKLLYGMMDSIAQANPDLVGIASSPEDMYANKKLGKLTILPTMENSLPIGNDLTRVDTLYNMGARMFGLCHSLNNNICDSSSDTLGSVFGGLSPFGEELVAHINKLGALIDVSHASDETFYDVVALSKTPIVASHSSVRAISNHDRNFTDDMLKTLKENGGVIQICILDRYVKEFPVNEEYNKEMSAAREAFYAIPSDSVEARRVARTAFSEIKSRYPDQNACLKDYVDHIDHVVKTIGVDYVGIGTDFDGGGGVVDCKDASQLIGITAELISRGYSDEDIQKIWGANFIRVFNKAIEYANSLK